MAQGTGDESSADLAQWLCQIRVELEDEAARLVRAGGNNPALQPVKDLLASHDATLVCQYDAFAGYCEEAERNGVENYPLYRWTRATIEDPSKKARYVKSFSLHVGGREVYEASSADALEKDLRPLVGGPVVRKLSKYDTNPANNPQVPERFR